jgi:hypothetical protein
MEGRIAALEAELATLEAELADPSVAADRDRVAERGGRHRDLQAELAWLLREWEATAEAAEAG